MCHLLGADIRQRADDFGAYNTVSFPSFTFFECLSNTENDFQSVTQRGFDFFIHELITFAK